MNAKPLLYVVTSVLLLTVGFLLDANSAKAEWDTTLTGPIVGGVERYYYTATGQAWVLGFDRVPPSWSRADARLDLPVPASEVKFLTIAGDWFVIVMRSGDSWAVNWTTPASHWQFCGPFSGQPIQTEGKSWGGVKNGYRK